MAKAYQCDCCETLNTGTASTLKLYGNRDQDNEDDAKGKRDALLDFEDLCVACRRKILNVVNQIFNERGNRTRL
jgi:hypothetical protein